MAIDPIIRKNWIEIQKRNDVPVNAIGVKIDSKDEKTFTVWRDEGIDQSTMDCHNHLGHCRHADNIGADSALAGDTAQQADSAPFELRVVIRDRLNESS